MGSFRIFLGWMVYDFGPVPGLRFRYSFLLSVASSHAAVHLDGIHHAHLLIVLRVDDGAFE